MRQAAQRAVIGFLFSPRGGSAHAARAIARHLGRNGFEVTLVAGSRPDLGADGDARAFFAGLDVRPVDLSAAAAAADPMRHEPGPGEAPMHPSYEDRPGAPDRVMAALDEEELELQVEAWGRELERAGAAAADLLYLHHLTPLHEAARRRFQRVPVVTQVHGSEMLMMERIERDPPPQWEHAEEWLRRMREWAAGSRRLVVNSPAGLERAAALLRVPRERFLLVPNGVDPSFAPRRLDRMALWRRHLVERPRGWRPGGEPGSVRYRRGDLAPLAGTVLIYTGRFTRVKRLPLLISAFRRARARLARRTALVLLGGYPGEWEGEHPFDAARRLGVQDAVFLAGWHGHDELPDFFAAADVLVHAAAREQFGQVIVEAMACGLPALAAASVGPATIVDHGETGWLVPPDDEEALAAAIVEAVDDPRERRRRGERARRRALERYSWPRIGARLAELLREATGATGLRGSAGSSRSRRGSPGRGSRPTPAA